MDLLKIFKSSIKMLLELFLATAFIKLGTIGKKFSEPTHFPLTTLS